MKPFLQIKLFMFFITWFLINVGCIDSQKKSTLEKYQWENVALGGGGYVTGMVIHPLNSAIRYIRTDVSGCYRWNDAEKRWDQLMEWVGFDEKNFFGIAGIAVDPSDTNIVYVAAGKYPDNEPYDLLKSSDGGKTWKRTHLNKRFLGNRSMVRYAGECIAVNPANGNEVYCGTNYDGLWVSGDGANTWSKIDEIPSDSSGDGVRIVQFGENNTVYAGVIGKGIYRKYEDSNKWSLMRNSPAQPRRMGYVNNDLFYVSDKEGVFRFKDGSWSDVSPVKNIEFSGLSVDPRNPGLVVVSERDGLGDKMYITRNGGDSWGMVLSNRHFSVPWWPESHFNAATSTLQFQHDEPGKLWMCDWYGVWFTPNVYKDTSDWYSVEDGHEEMVTFVVKSLPEGPNLITGVADNRGFVQSDIQKYPDSRFLIEGLQDVTGLDFAAQKPSFIAIVGGKRKPGTGYGGYSLDYGKSWQKFNSLPSPSSIYGRIAVSASGNSIVWIPVGEPPAVSSDRGESWQYAKNAPLAVPAGRVGDLWTWNEPLAADQVDDELFYLYYMGKFYRSTDGGKSWEYTCSFGNGNLKWYHLDLFNGGYLSMIKAVPEKKGHVWASLEDGSVFFSNDQGKKFSKLDSLSEVLLIAFGKNPPGKNYPAVFIYGSVNDISGIFRSDDYGKSWVQINDQTVKIGNWPNSMAGDMQLFGRVYIGTRGTGIFYGEPMNECMYE